MSEFIFLFFGGGFNEKLVCCRILVVILGNVSVVFKYVIGFDFVDVICVNEMLCLRMLIRNKGRYGEMILLML